MADLKFSKIELVELRGRLELCKRYLPTLQLKKSMLQMQVMKASKEIEVNERQWFKEKALLKGFSKLLSEKSMTDCEEAVRVKDIILESENIAGIEVPIFKDIHFHEPSGMLISQPLWVDDMISLMRSLRKVKEKLVASEEKKRILEVELRIISIRVNLFEKRLIPNLERDILSIKIFLSDQELQFVAQAKVCKNKSVAKREAEELIA